MVDYIRVPFGASGDRTAIPVTGASPGPISYTYGYGLNYSLPRSSNPSALTIPRESFNQLMFSITSNVQQYQQVGAPEFITSADNGGTPYGYTRGATVRYNNGTTTERYRSLVDSNTELPTNVANWALLTDAPNTGDWNGNVITGAKGGTGVANTGRTITLGGNLATTGAFNTTLAVTAATSVTLPTAGTLATLAGAEALTNKSVNGVTLTAAGSASTFLNGAGAYAGVTSPQIAAISASVASNALTVTLEPATIDFRSATLTSGTVNSRVLASASSVVVPSGATLGTVNGIQERLVIIAIDNAGTVEAAIVNLSGGVNLNEEGVISTTAISGASNSAGVVYSTTARTNAPYKIRGFVDSTQATAGTWATAPSLIAGAGGNVANSMSSIGYGQTWQSVTRTLGTTYYNTTSKPINLCSTAYAATVGIPTDLSINIGGLGVFVFCAVGPTSNGAGSGSVIIPPSASYVLSGTSLAIATHRELR